MIIVPSFGLFEFFYLIVGRLLLWRRLEDKRGLFAVLFLNVQLSSLRRVFVEKDAGGELQLFCLRRSTRIIGFASGFDSACVCLL